MLEKRANTAYCFYITKYIYYTIFIIYKILVRVRTVAYRIDDYIKYIKGNVMKTMIYMDHAATTQLHPKALREMLPYYEEKYGNPSSLYPLAKVNREAIERARQLIAKTLHTTGEHIFFTSGGTESDNWALNGLICPRRPCHIITSQIEHHAILHAAKNLEQKGYRVTYLPVDRYGTVEPRMVEANIRRDTGLISIHFANNEIGTIEDVGAIGEIAKKYRIAFHTDAVQAYGHVPIDVENMQIDLLSASSHKFNGPKGVGFLYIRNPKLLHSMIYGGPQEMGKRAGTENVPGIVGMASAARLAHETMEERSAYECALRDYMIGRILSEIEYSVLNGHPTKRLSNNIHISFQFIESSALLVMLAQQGICVSGGSACNSATGTSHVLSAIKVPQDYARGSIRITIGAENTKQQVDYVVDTLKNCVKLLRSSSPQYEDYISNRIS